MKCKCLSMLSDLQQYKNHSKDELFLKYINERLDKSFKTYEKELQDGLEYLERRNELNVAKKINRLK